jgi:hypothetical protein
MMRAKLIETDQVDLEHMSLTFAPTKGLIRLLRMIVRNSCRPCGNSDFTEKWLVSTEFLRFGEPVKDENRRKSAEIPSTGARSGEFSHRRVV